MIRSLIVFLATLVAYVNAECPNACSSHGRCSSYDMCICYRNWMANDCSERVCQFGLAHVDSPKGDLDASGNKLTGATGPNDIVIENNDVYPYGTTEQYPRMMDSRDTVLTNSAHYYMECSNKGICDREKGVCECFPGYEGSACQRASCPANENGVCSGHGTCETIQDLANNQDGNIYQLWDEESTMGCNCDAGYYGPDCSQRRCKYGADPLYADDEHATPRVANFTFGIFAEAPGIEIRGNFSLIFYDVFGEDWETEPIPMNIGGTLDDDEIEADCDMIIDRLVSLPNRVIPENSLLCIEQDNADGEGYTVSGDDFHVYKVFTLAFTGNVGVLKQPKVNFYLDGPRPTLYSDEAVSTLDSFVFADGFHGEFDDYVPDLCEGVEVTIIQDSGLWILGDLTAAEVKKLKKCLGDGNNDPSDNEQDDVENWDTGDDDHPHLIKLVPKQTEPPIQRRLCNSTSIYSPYFEEEGWCDDLKPAGFYAPLVYGAPSYAGKFLLFGKQGVDYHLTATTQTFYVYTTKGYLERRSDAVVVTKSANDRYGNVLTVDGSVAGNRLDCESRSQSDGYCLEKGDRIFIFDYDAPENNLFKYPNMYTINKISTSRSDDAVYKTEITLDYGTNFPGQEDVSFYKFIPPVNGGVSWAKECSDRGVCQADTGICSCFKGYTHDDCSEQNILAK